MSVAWVGAGIAAVSAISSISSGKKQEKAAKAAGDQAQLNYDQTRSDNMRMYDQQREDYTPFREVGNSSIRELALRSAPGGDFTKSYERGNFEVDPGYQFRLEQGEQGINRAAAARGGWNSGATLKALAKFNSNLGAQEYGAWDQRQNNRESQFNQNREFQRNNLASMAGLGQTATAGTVQAGAQAQGQINQAGQFNTALQGQSLQNAGEARASGYVGAGNAISSGIKQIYNGYQDNEALKKIGGTPSGGASNGAYFDGYGYMANGQ